MINSNEKQSNKISVRCSRRSCKTPDEQVRGQKKFEAQSATEKRGAYNRHKCIKIINWVDWMGRQAHTRAHARMHECMAGEGYLRIHKTTEAETQCEIKKKIYGEFQCCGERSRPRARRPRGVYRPRTGLAPIRRSHVEVRRAEVRGRA